MSNLPSGHHLTRLSLKKGAIGDANNKRIDRHCDECGRYERNLWRGMCDACAKRVRYNTDVKFRRKELKRNKEYRNRKKAKGSCAERL